MVRNSKGQTIRYNYQIIYTNKQGAKRYYGEYTLLKDALAMVDELWKLGSSTDKPSDIQSVTLIFLGAI